MDISTKLAQIPVKLKNKGKAYYDEGLVSECTYDEEENTFNAVVYGSYLYHTSISFKGQDIDEIICSCPVEGLCKHAVALMYYIKEHAHTYKSFIKSTSNKQINLDNIYEETLLFHQNENKLKDIINFSYHFNFNHQLIINLYDFHERVYRVFCALKDKVHNEHLKLYIHTYLKNYVSKQSSITPIKRTLSEIGDPFLKELYYESIILNRIDLLYSDYKNVPNLMNQIINTLDKYRRFDILMDIHDEVFFNKLAKAVGQSDKITLKVIFKFLHEKTPNVFDEVLTELSKVEAKQIFEKTVTKILTLEEALYYKKVIDIPIDYKKIHLTYEDILKNLEEIKMYDKDNFIWFIEEDMYNFGRQRLFSLEDYMMLLHSMNYTFDYDTNYMHFYYGHKLGFRPLKNTVNIVHKGLPNDIKKRYPRNYFYHHRTDAHPYEALLHLNSESDKEKLYVFDFYNHRGPLVIFDLEDDIFEPLDEYTYMRIDRFKDSFLNVDTTPEIDNNYQELKVQLSQNRLRYQEAKKEVETNKYIDTLISELQDEVVIQTHEKVDLEVILSLSNMLMYHSNVYVVREDTLFGLKVGINHKYFVKSLEQFIDLVENRQTHSYGVKLAFNHHINNFSLKAQKIINVLESSRGFYPINNNIGGLLSQKNSTLLFSILKGESIYLHGADFDKRYQLIHYKTEDFKIEFKLHNKGYTLNLEDIMHDESMILIYKEVDLYINLKDKYMQSLSYANDREKKLVHFLLLNENFDVSSAMPKLISKVIPLLGEDVKVDDALLKIVESNKLTIESYFDFDDKLDIIYLEFKVYKNEVLLDNNLINKYDVTFIKYLNLLATFGFNDYKLTNQQDILVFLSADLAPFKAFGKVYRTNAIVQKSVVQKIQASISVTLVDNMLKTHIESKLLDQKHLKKVLEAYRLGKKYILVNDNVILLQTDEIRHLNQFLEKNDIQLTKLEASEKPIYEVFKLDNEEKHLKVHIEDNLKMIINDIIHYKNFEIKNKPSMYPLLKKYQIDGLKWLHVLAKHKLGGILADEMGLGKTLQMISFLESSDSGLSMVVCPKSLIYNWAHELIKFGSNIKPLIFVGTKDMREAILEDVRNSKDKTLIIVSYDTLRNDIEYFKDINLTTLILDEAQHIKTSSALKTKAVKMLNATNKFILTGTPIENSIFDLWSMFDFMMPGYLYSQTKFKKLGDKVHESDKDTMDFLITKTKPFILRRTKKEVLKELPEKIEEVMYASFDGKHKSMYDAYLLEVKSKLEDEDVTKFDLLKDITRLRQLCISPKLVYDNYEDEHVKLDVIYDLVKEAIDSNHKVLVFSSFVKALDLLKLYFDEKDYYMLTGETKAKDRMEMSEEFNNNKSDKKVFLISLKAGGTGLNLTGADVVIHMDPWWNLAAENQASDRAHRIGQKRSVTVYKVVMKDTIEEKIILLQNKKRELFEQMIEHKIDIEKLDSDDYKFILS